MVRVTNSLSRKVIGCFLSRDIIKLNQESAILVDFLVDGAMDSDSVSHVASFLDAGEACRLASTCQRLFKDTEGVMAYWKDLDNYLKELREELKGLISQQKRWTLIDPNPHVEHHIRLNLDSLCASMLATRKYPSASRWHLTLISSVFEYVWGSSLTWVGLCRDPERHDVASRLSALCRLAEESAAQLYSNSDVLVYRRKKRTSFNYFCLKNHYSHIFCSPQHKWRYARDLYSHDWIDLDTGIKCEQPPPDTSLSLLALRRNSSFDAFVSRSSSLRLA